MKKITLLFFLLTFSLGFSQDLLLGFESGESGGVNHCLMIFVERKSRRNVGAFDLGARREPVRHRTLERVHALRAFNDGPAVEIDGPPQRRPVGFSGQDHSAASM